VLIGLAKDGHVIVPPFLESDAAGAAVQVEAGFDACNGAFFDEGAQTSDTPLPENGRFLPSFPLFVPGLSWQNDHFYI
jgi:hypothetical protein